MSTSTLTVMRHLIVSSWATGRRGASALPAWAGPTRGRLRSTSATWRGCWRPDRPGQRDEGAHPPAWLMLRPTPRARSPARGACWKPGTTTRNSARAAGARRPPRPGPARWARSRARSRPCRWPAPRSARRSSATGTRWRIVAPDARASSAARSGPPASRASRTLSVTSTGRPRSRSPPWPRQPRPPAAGAARYSPPGPFRSAWVVPPWGCSSWSRLPGCSPGGVRRPQARSAMRGLQQGGTDAAAAASTTGSLGPAERRGGSARRSPGQRDRPLGPPAHAAAATATPGNAARADDVQAERAGARRRSGAQRPGQGRGVPGQVEAAEGWARKPARARARPAGPAGRARGDAVDRWLMPSVPEWNGCGSRASWPGELYRLSRLLSRRTGGPATRLLLLRPQRPARTATRRCRRPGARRPRHAQLDATAGRPQTPVRRADRQAKRDPFRATCSRVPSYRPPYPAGQARRSPAPPRYRGCASADGAGGSPAPAAAQDASRSGGLLDNPGGTSIMRFEAPGQASLVGEPGLRRGLRGGTPRSSSRRACWTRSCRDTRAEAARAAGRPASGRTAKPRGQRQLLQRGGW